MKMLSGHGTGVGLDFAATAGGLGQRWHNECSNCQQNTGVFHGSSSVVIPAASSIASGCYSLTFTTER
jgi:hypothetical protein